MQSVVFNIDGDLFSINPNTEVDDQFTLAARRAFEDPWNRMHLVRTVAVVASFGCCLAAITVA